MKKPSKYDHLRKPPGSVHSLYGEETKDDKIARIGLMLLLVVVVYGGIIAGGIIAAIINAPTSGAH